ncbi:unnamed protein product [Danaus chrysippus]|uniref:(African queen) hypothetical protein n=1 Tax=Danaus chrysippus TaxID=151541 RepID=A0A8J2W426_9NEOP|nr:unnamed protein product [Danaus chrysippus]
MFILASIILLLNPASIESRLSHFHDTGDEKLSGVAFDTSDENDDEQDDDLEPGKVDLIKDGMWAIKAKLKEIKAFNRALVANIKLTNMKLKEIIENQIAIKKHQHNLQDNKKFIHKYQILSYTLVASQPVPIADNHYVKQNVPQHVPNAQSIPKQGDTLNENDEQIISVRITSSVAVGRTKPRPSIANNEKSKDVMSQDTRITTPAIEVIQPFASTTDIDDVTTALPTTILEDLESVTDIPPNLIGANIEYINQLKAKKGTRGLSNYERLHSFTSNDGYPSSNKTNDSVAESSILGHDDEVDEVPIARNVPLSYYKNNIQEPTRANTRLTTVNFNVVHENQKVPKYNDRLPPYVNQNQNVGDQKFYNTPSQIYSQPAQVYSEPAKFYSEPAKIYSEPAKIYSEPAKIYGEPSKIYSEPAKFYSQPASLHLSPEPEQERRPWQPQKLKSTTISTTQAASTGPYQQNPQRSTDHEPERNYEVDEKLSVMTDGRSHGEQTTDIDNPENCKQENCKVGYVVEGRQFRKYRVEERTPDGFIVGEYGVVRNEDGALRGVRYTADSDASPRLIHDALMKFLQLK